MLNKEGIRELAYVTHVTEIRPIEGADKVELAVIGAGWQVMVRKEQFKAGDLCVYFEIDSKVPKIEQFEFLSKYDYKVKTQKFLKGKVVSQGLIMTPKELGLEDVKEGDFLTKKLGVTYSEPEDNTRKASQKELIEKRVAQRLATWCAKHKLLSRFIWIINLKVKAFTNAEKKRLKHEKREWPSWVVKTDEERCQNLPNLFPGDGTWWIATEKIDGSSTTFTMKQNKPKKRRAIVCSRNVAFDPKVDVNDYVDMYKKYNFETVLNYLLDQSRNTEYVTIQGEMYGKGVQKRTYGVEEKRLAIFNIIVKKVGDPEKRLNPIDMSTLVSDLNKQLGLSLEIVPVLTEQFTIPKTCEELLLEADGLSRIDAQIREGLVIRDYSGKRSFKAVSNKYLLSK